MTVLYIDQNVTGSTATTAGEWVLVDDVSVAGGVPQWAQDAYRAARLKAWRRRHGRRPAPGEQDPRAPRKGWRR